MVSRTVRAAALLAALGTSVATAAPCALPAGKQVVLKSVEIDPDVFVWDSKQRVVDYAAGSWRSTREVLVHTVLAKPGTRAMIVQCDAGIVRQKYVSDTLDAVGIRLLDGPNRGHYGWVTSQDVRPPTHT
ncbi:MAG TPA: hypothetical protein VGN14_10610 [Candidatus Elarobacter sp.]